MTNITSLTTTTTAPPFKIKEGRTAITPQLANQILNHCLYKGQRRLQQSHVDKWTTMIVDDRGEFLRDQGISFGRLDGRLHLLNGQHRLHAVVKSGRTVSFDITIYECKDEVDLARHYARFDSESVSRSLKDIVANDAMVAPDFPASYVAKLCEAVMIIDSRFRNTSARKLPPGSRIRERRLALAREWHRYAKQYKELSKGIAIGKVARFYAQVPMAVALVTLRYQPKEAEIFWRRAMEDDGLKHGDPARALRDAWAKIGPNRTKHWTKYELGWLAAQAWNAEFQQKRIQRLTVPTKKDADIYIEGAPY